ncbi:hypothetical protein Ae201684P_021937 [Aphanomyces euteiches]|uniref:Uncharacterized protein n=1 Tax=Aphanomyces euteiches TaxID=100861 RepID=A0A6G0WSN0_9STRA|nr:hypothetical protein Ae201684_012129 [Aphanomyces euteiches]KAH9056200.1 hypothetical protein Ae201684P_021937 [Aphanomyces euteiches]
MRVAGSQQNKTWISFGRCSKFSIVYLQWLGIALTQIHVQLTENRLMPTEINVQDGDTVVSWLIAMLKKLLDIVEVSISDRVSIPP